VVKKSHLIITYVFADEEGVKNLTEHIEDIAVINLWFNVDWKKLRGIIELFDEMRTIITRK